MKYGLSESQRQEIIDILSSYKKVEQAILFGSRAIDTYKEASDVDIAIKGEKADWSLAMTVKDHLEEETYLPFFFDVVAYGSVESEALKRHIDTEGKVLVDRGGSEWRETNVSEIIELVGGGTPKTKVSEYWNGDIPWLSVVDFNTGNKFVFDTEKKITQAGLENSSTKLLDMGDIIISARGTVGVVAMLGKQMAFNQSCYGVKAVDGKSTNNYVYYLLKDAISNFLQIAHGGVFDTITRDTFKEIDILLPALAEQKAIAEVLSSLDDKIDLLHRQNKTLEQMAQTLFRQWFVEEAGEDWEETTLGDVIDIFDSKRIPLSKMQRDKMKIGKLYPYYGAASIMDYVNDYIFDGEYILIGEDGTVRTSEGYPVLQYATGKFWVNNHTHVIRAKAPYNNYFIWNYLSKKNIDRIVTGAVQPKINQTNLKSLEFPVVPDYLLNKYIEITDEQFIKINKNKQQIRTLESLRDTLLPKLMSGEIRVAI
jgi:type I restriction enzyme S subunit